MHCSELPSRMTYSYRECCRQAVLVCHRRNCPSWRVHWPRSHLLPGWPISNNKLTCATKSFPFRSPSGTSLKVIPSLELPTGSTESSISSIIVSASHCVQSCILLFSSMGVNPKGILQKSPTCKSLYSSASQGTQTVTLIDLSLCTLLGVQTFLLWKYSNCTNLI